VSGIVQGVGFRPFVNRLARQYALAGFVANFSGGVLVEVEGWPKDVEKFLQSLREHPPPIAVIEHVCAEDIQPIGQREFYIRPSEGARRGPVYVSPDVAICADCARELRDPEDRRYRHPFINCTNCGPRFTIIQRIPYDRPHTSMAQFTMCENCAAEYEDINDRRYHAQPVACPACGPTVDLVPSPGRPRVVHGRQVGRQAIQRTRELLAEGAVVAIKGIGGFHLACDAGNEDAVLALRARKRREQKPFAIMVASLNAARDIAHIGADAAELLTSSKAPVVLAAKRRPEPLAPSIAPDSSDYGILLPYTPLHLLLLEDAPYPALVMTSGNISDEPLCTSNGEAITRLANIADAFLLHDRSIVTGCDDSVVRIASTGPIIMRRSRGYVPFPVRLGQPLETVLAVGAQLKNTFCISSGENAFLSQHMGDLDNEATLRFFESSVEHLKHVLQVEPDMVACDTHPDYLSTRYAGETALRLKLPLVQAQHHHAHIVSCMADNGFTDPVIGLACDGTGLGDDGTMWGCEVLLCTPADYRRMGHLDPIPLPGCDVAIRQPWRTALSYLVACGLDDQVKALRKRLRGQVSDDAFGMVRAMLRQSVNCPQASSAGRLFDAVSATLGLCTESAYEAQAPIALEAAATPTTDSYGFQVGQGDKGIWRMDPSEIFATIMRDLSAGVDTGEIAGRFHNTVAEMLVECVARCAQQAGINYVALSGGTFQNRLLLAEVYQLLEERGMTPLLHRSVPPNDGGISVGQAVIASARAPVARPAR